MQPFIIILYNEPLSSSAYNREAEAGVLNEVKMVEEALLELNIKHKKLAIRKLADLQQLSELPADSVIINLVEALPEDTPYAFNDVPKICAEMGLACTGNSSETLHLTFNKKKTKEKLASIGIKTPPDVLINKDAILNHISPYFPPPWILKPCAADGSEGIDVDKSFVEDISTLRERIKEMRQFFGDILIEQYIEGREINQAIWEFNNEIIILPPAEIDFSLFPSNRKHIVDYAVKWYQGTIPHHISPRKIPAKLEPELQTKISEIAKQSFIACGASDYARIDMRVDHNNDVFVLEINANPDISPQAGFPAALKAAGIEFRNFIMKLIINATKSKKENKNYFQISN